MNEKLFSNQELLRRLPAGPLGSHIDIFVSVLYGRGYTKLTVKQKIPIISELSQWLHKQHLGIEGLNEFWINKFIRHREKRNRLGRGNRSTLKQFKNFLREEGILPASVPEIEDSPLQRIENTFALYLEQERGLSQDTLDNYLPIVRRFLMERFHNRKIFLDKLRSQDISGFILHYAHTMSPGRAQLTVSALRSFLRFLYKRGEIATDLAAAVPTVAKWRFSGIPKFLQQEQVERLLQSCDQNTAAGQRDYAILLLLSRLGLRAGEVMHMDLDDIHWESGELIVRGKSSREERLPLPHDVGQAIAAYLRHSRPHCSSRRVFIRLFAPHQGFSSSVAVCDVVRRSLARAGLNLDFKGAHLLRHTLATNMLRGGATFTEIGEILRHQHPSTTEIYAKVDIEALRSIAQPWPGGEA